MSETRTTLAHITKLSDLLELGLADLRKQEEAPNSVVDMNCWIQQNGICRACVAGAVMRFSLGVELGKGEGADPWGRDDRNEFLRLIALDYLREGRVESAAEKLGLRTKLFGRRVPDYKRNSDGWWSAMRTLLADLQKAGE